MPLSEAGSQRGGDRRPIRLSVLDQSPVADGSSSAQALHNTLELAELADRRGYERYWVAEHHALVSHAGSVPEVLIAAIAARTSGIRVGSGGVLLHFHSPMKVAETFRVLDLVHPGRIDLGIGRSGGGASAESIALRPDLATLGLADDFDHKLAELLAFLHGRFPAAHPFGTIPLMPSGAGAPPPVWLLGSSPRSAVFAAELGLPYAFAHFISPSPTRAAVETYRARFRPGLVTDRPRTIVGLGVYCADTEQEARRLYASHLLVRRRLMRNDIRPVPTADDAVKELRTGPDPLAGEVSEWPHYTVGTPEQVREIILRMSTELDVDEFVVMNMIADHGDRLRCYDLLADALELPRRPDAATPGAGISAGAGAGVGAGVGVGVAGGPA
ncbi:LLM class flavin-dependent oxidoreductase [Protofrankia symbiont of Coriaria ruscifolia]|uniref:LLM class flavin-dependent oxidoreductase n=1 Tax=Protofrankia symbiont of Coriaria ruscifolia TaxID=1306542 RepID=UPI001040E55F|nr:LLM class flavin-dependent oxidoreductase [Protofrankia symbiont of Coriaria ruscifolia]